MATLICARTGCGQEKYAHHSSTAPHAGTGDPPCAGYQPAHPCDRCGLDLEQHEPDEPHVRIIDEMVVCVGAQWQGTDEPPFEGGGGSSGGGGASGGW